MKDYSMHIIAAISCAAVLLFFVAVIAYANTYTASIVGTICAIAAAAITGLLIVDAAAEYKLKVSR